MTYCTISLLLACVLLTACQPVETYRAANAKLAAGADAWRCKGMSVGEWYERHPTKATRKAWAKACGRKAP